MRMFIRKLGTPCMDCNEENDISQASTLEILKQDLEEAQMKQQIWSNLYQMTGLSCFDKWEKQSTYQIANLEQRILHCNITL